MRPTTQAELLAGPEVANPLRRYMDRRSGRRVATDARAVLSDAEAPDRPNAAVRLSGPQRSPVFWTLVFRPSPWVETCTADLSL